MLIILKLTSLDDSIIALISGISLFLFQANNQEGKKSKADIGIYNSSKDIIKLKGNVIILNQNSKITGSNGITNIKTGISKITGSPNKKERVKGIFFPTNNKKKGGYAE